MNDRKIIDYQTLSGDFIQIDNYVREALLQGWQPYGGVCAIPENSDAYDSAVYFYQAMVKYESIIP